MILKLLQPRIRTALIKDAEAITAIYYAPYQSSSIISFEEKRLKTIKNKALELMHG